MRNTILPKLVKILPFFNRNHQTIVDCPATNAKCSNSSGCKPYYRITALQFIFKEFFESMSNAPDKEGFPSSSSTININTDRIRLVRSSSTNFFKISYDL